MTEQELVEREVLAELAQGMDDLCHGVDQTICGLEFGFDFCEHGNDPDTCVEYSCQGEDDF